VNCEAMELGSLGNVGDNPTTDVCILSAVGSGETILVL